MANSFTGADHLPNNRPDGPPDPAGLPRQRKGTTPQMHGRYPDFDVMENRSHWDPVTRQALEQRNAGSPPYRFFDGGEQRTLRAFLDAALAQDAEPRIPVLAMIDERMYERKFDGYRYDDMPPDDEVWRALAVRLEGFADLSAEEQLETVGRLAKGELEWPGMNVSRAWSTVMRYALSAFYSHPWAFNEIGFRGPAYPRGYMRRNMGPSGVDPAEPQEAFSIDPVRDTAERS